MNKREDSAPDGAGNGATETALQAPVIAAPPAGRRGLTSENEVGRAIGPYKVLSILGEGGFGVVYLAEQTEPVRRRIALKVIKPGMDSRQVLARFEQERQALALMDHPHVAKVLDAGSTSDGRPYFVMEHVPGEPITEFADKHRLSLPERLNLFISVCEAVQHAHQKGIIHRDIKPSNILVEYVDSKPMPKVIDFGVAKATAHHLTEKTIFTEQGQFIGTPEYMSPEQAEMSAVDIDTRSDIYSLGVLLYELLTGTLPFEAKTLRSKALSEIQRIIREVEPPRPSTRLGRPTDAPAQAGAPAQGDEKARAGAPTSLADVASRRRLDSRTLVRSLRGDLDWIVMKCLEKDRARRYDTANGLAAEVKRYINHEPVLAGPPSAAYRSRKFFRRHRVGVFASAAILLTLVAGIVGTGYGMVEALSQRRAAESARADEARQRRLAEESARLATTRLAETSAREAMLARQRGQWKQVISAADEALKIGLDDPWPTRFLRLEAVANLRPIGVDAELVSLESLPGAEGHRAILELWRAEPRFSKSGDPDAIAKYARRALELGLAGANEFYARAIIAGTIPESIGHLEQVLDLDPFHSRANQLLITFYMLSGRYDDGERRVRAWLLAEPGSVTAQSILLGIVATTGRLDEAESLIASLDSRTDPTVIKAQRDTLKSYGDGKFGGDIFHLEPWRAADAYKLIGTHVAATATSYGTENTQGGATGQGLTPASRRFYLLQLQTTGGALFSSGFKMNPKSTAELFRLCPSPQTAMMHGAALSGAQENREASDVLEYYFQAGQSNPLLGSLPAKAAVLAALGWFVEESDPGLRAVARRRALECARRIVAEGPSDPVLASVLAFAATTIDERWLLEYAIADLRAFEHVRPIEYKRAAAFQSIGGAGIEVLFLVEHGLIRAPGDTDLTKLRDDAIASIRKLMRKMKAPERFGIILEALGHPTPEPATKQ